MGGWELRKLSEKRTIELTEDMNTIESLYKDLLNLSDLKGEIVLIHSSLSSLGWVCGGAQAVIMALKQAVGESGTLVMTAHSGDISDPAEWINPPVPKEWIEKIYENMPAFDVNLSATRGMGRIAELFRTLPDSVRSNHPQVSFSASGKYAEAVIEKHQLTPQFGMNTPLGKLYEINAKVLLLGVGYSACTSFHLAEALNDRMPRKRMGAAITVNKKRVWTWFEDYAYDSDRIFNTKDAVGFAVKWMNKNRFNSSIK
jgi:aminoglycoside 3-N-acetyltransferase